MWGFLSENYFAVPGKIMARGYIIKMPEIDIIIITGDYMMFAMEGAGWLRESGEKKTSMFM